MCVWCTVLSSIKWFLSMCVWPTSKRANTTTGDEDKLIAAMTTPSPSDSAPAAAVLLPQNVGVHGIVAPFHSAQEDWCDYTERLHHYFTANVITGEDKRRAILLTAVGPVTYKLFKTLASPTPVTDLTFEQLVEKAKLHFNLKPSPIVSTFVAELR